MKSTNSLRTCVALLAVAGAGACAKDPKPSELSQRAAATSGEIVQTEVLSAIVQEVDSKQRVIALKDENGRPFIVDVGDSVPIERIHPSDWVNVRYQESVAFSLQEAGRTDRKPFVEQSTTRVPNGIQFGRKISTIVEILSITPDGSHTTFRVPEGMVRTVYVDDLPNQKKLSHLKPGDEVAVTYTEKLAVALDSARN